MAEAQGTGASSYRAPVKKTVTKTVTTYKPAAPPKTTAPTRSTGSTTRTTPTKASQKNARQAHNQWQGVEPGSSGKAREGKGLKMKRGRAAGPAAKATARSKASQRSAQAVRDITGNAYRDYASSLTNLAQTGIRPPGHGGFQMPNLNPFDYAGRGLSGLGGAVRDAFGNIVPQDVLFKNISNRLSDPTRRR